MKKYFLLFFIVFIGMNGTMTAQEADKKIDSLIDQSDWFSVEEEYPKLKSKMESESLKQLSEAVIGRYFNRPQHSIQAIDWLLANTEEEFGIGMMASLNWIKSQILGEQGLYAESADNILNFLAKNSERLDSNDISALNQMAEYYGKLRNVRKPEVIRPNKDIVIPITIEKVGRGEWMYLPVSINGKSYKFCFDTGATSTYFSERFANEIGVRITDGSFKIVGMTATMGKRGTIDSLMVGDIVFKNPSLFISADSTLRLDAVLGMDFMRRMGEVQIYPQERKIVFPAKKTVLPSSGRNLLFWGEQPSLKAYSNGERLIFNFDTGNRKSDLHDVYYQKHKVELDKIYEKKSVRREGLGGYRMMDTYQIPTFSLTVGETPVELTNIEVFVNNRYDAPNSRDDGSLGMDFITAFRKVTINFEDMFVKVEK